MALARSYAWGLIGSHRVGRGAIRPPLPLVGCAQVKLKPEPFCSEPRANVGPWVSARTKTNMLRSDAKRLITIGFLPVNGVDSRTWTTPSSHRELALSIRGSTDNSFPPAYSGRPQETGPGATDSAPGGRYNSPERRRRERVGDISSASESGTVRARRVRGPEHPPRATAPNGPPGATR